MKRRTNILFALCAAMFTPVYAASVLDVMPSSTSPVAISATGGSYLTFTVKNNTAKTIKALSVDPGFGGLGNFLNLSLSNNQCSNLSLSPYASCSFTVSVKGINQTATATLMPRVCGFNGVVCSVPVLNNRVTVIASRSMPSSNFPKPYAGTFYPLYNSGVNQWITPDVSMPFDKVSAIFASFAHTYQQGNGAVFSFERSQVDEPARLALLSQVARGVNPSIKILISLGWGHNDWGYINDDYINHANIFVPSVIQFIRNNHLDGLDIDNENIGGTSGSISQANFDGVIANLRNALNYASLQDGKPYYLTVTPAGDSQQPGGIVDTQVDAQNASSFDLVNIQSYFDNGENFAVNFYQGLLAIGYPMSQIANGINTEGCEPDLPQPFIGLAGLFNWTMSADSACNNFEYTKEIAELVGYPK
ncbi:MAG: glycosyl hydrolase family 18 protein [Gammaproteobacteria bacterium]|nr:glycosyl hydrolase family 18 protein [Gammaproteobacteria bacterium]